MRRPSARRAEPPFSNSVLTVCLRALPNHARIVTPYILPGSSRICLCNTQGMRPTIESMEGSFAPSKQINCSSGWG